MKPMSSVSQQLLDAQIAVPDGLPVRIILQPDEAAQTALRGVGPGVEQFAIHPNRIVMSAANAIDDNNDAAPAATRDLTLRIGFALLCGEAGNGGLTSQNSPPDDGTESLSAA